ncbi:TRAPP, putative [Trypanosoma brucei gambiense DAL972]|uniref:Trafficking protein particle complex subunit n=2 Tax=Trypanosoma brucei TaxID=5691 RepID=C9ZVV4_TRYB9|nr:TRAPP, putative [Trypanosoma brucei gambiense DAL972]RHW73030.1 trafficking protein particle complex subunit 3 [Trypanosoma brucei equiperdum]CBH13542.1 TRAPP, putative [Trypanosoma brucei gambiense DAL972]|eukprot:XP_011775819.1 TRAPP, putative [Trypanosoma brucei gambiense DAL972]
MSQQRQVAAKLGEVAFDSGEKASAEFFAITYGALVQQMITDLPQADDVEVVNQQLDTMGRRIGSRLVEEYSARSGAPACRTFAQAADAVAIVGIKMFLNVNATVQPAEESGGGTFTLTFADNPLALFVELPEGPVRQRLWYSNVICGVIVGALSMVGFIAEATFVRDTLRGDATNEILLSFKGREKETFKVEQ